MLIDEEAYHHPYHKASAKIEAFGKDMDGHTIYNPERQDHIEGIEDHAEPVEIHILRIREEGLEPAVVSRNLDHGPDEEGSAIHSSPANKDIIEDLIARGDEKERQDDEGAS